MKSEATKWVRDHFLNFTGELISFAWSFAWFAKISCRFKKCSKAACQLHVKRLPNCQNRFLLIGFWLLCTFFPLVPDWFISAFCIELAWHQKSNSVCFLLAVRNRKQKMKPRNDYMLSQQREYFAKFVAKRLSDLHLLKTSWFLGWRHKLITAYNKSEEKPLLAGYV